MGAVKFVNASSVVTSRGAATGVLCSNGRRLLGSVDDEMAVSLLKTVSKLRKKARLHVGTICLSFDCCSHSVLLSIGCDLFRPIAPVGDSQGHQVCLR